MKRFLMIPALVAMSAQAGVESGHGGGALVCFGSKATADAAKAAGKVLDSHLSDVRAVTTYDLYLARLGKGLHGQAPTLLAPAPGESADELTHRLIDRIEYAVGDTAKPYRKAMADVGELRYLEKPEAIDLIQGEAPMYPLPDSCVLANIAIRRESQGYIQVDSRLYRHPSFTDLDRHTLKVHEYFQSGTSKARRCVAETQSNTYAEGHGRSTSYEPCEYPVINDTTRKLVGWALNESSTPVELRDKVFEPQTYPPTYEKYRRDISRSNQFSETFIETWYIKHSSLVEPRPVIHADVQEKRTIESLESALASGAGEVQARIWKAQKPELKEAIVAKLREAAGPGYALEAFANDLFSISVAIPGADGRPTTSIRAGSDLQACWSLNGWSPRLCRGFLTQVEQALSQGCKKEQLKRVAGSNIRTKEDCLALARWASATKAQLPEVRDEADIKAEFVRELQGRVQLNAENWVRDNLPLRADHPSTDREALAKIEARLQKMMSKAGECAAKSADEKFIDRKRVIDFQSRPVPIGAPESKGRVDEFNWESPIFFSDEGFASSMRWCL